jgi:hypothetical protein
MSQVEENKSSRSVDEELDDNVGYLIYNETVINHFTRPRNVGEIKDPDAMAVVGDPSCGDYVRVYINVRDGKISEMSSRQPVASRQERPIVPYWQSEDYTKRLLIIGRNGPKKWR